MARRLVRAVRPGVAPPSSPDEAIQLTLTGMAPTGEAIGRHAGMVVFVPYGLPGEQVRVRLTVRKRNFARGVILAVEQPSPARVSPPCPYFGRCGGCDWQHAAYAAQLEYKTGIVREQLARIGKLPDAEVRTCVPGPQPYQYRNHARLAVDQHARPGYRAAGSHAVVAVDECRILEPALQLELQRVVQGGSTVAPLPPGEEIELRVWADHILVAGFDYLVSPGVFFQANTAIAEAIVAEVIAAAAWRGCERVLDLYCGAGLFTVPLGRKAAAVVGVEANPAAAADARANLAAAGIDGEILAQDVATALTTLALTAKWDVVVLDPPRGGVDAEAVSRLTGLAAPKIVYVSCEPATLARDARLICDAGYTLAHVQPFDMFPQTRHVESVAVFEL
jgi:23S rRNA (uracil1939-C5)-methyltransferase